MLLLRPRNSIWNDFNQTWGIKGGYVGQPEFSQSIAPPGSVTPAIALTLEVVRMGRPANSQLRKDAIP